MRFGMSGPWICTLLVPCRLLRSIISKKTTSARLASKEENRHAKLAWHCQLFFWESEHGVSEEVHR
jgi:hypothetical protein